MIPILNLLQNYDKIRRVCIERDRTVKSIAAGPMDAINRLREDRRLQNTTRRIDRSDGLRASRAADMALLPIEWRVGTDQGLASSSTNVSSRGQKRAHDDRNESTEPAALQTTTQDGIQDVNTLPSQQVKKRKEDEDKEIDNVTTLILDVEADQEKRANHQEKRDYQIRNEIRQCILYPRSDQKTAVKVLISKYDFWAVKDCVDRLLATENKTAKVKCLKAMQEFMMELSNF